MCCAAHTLAKTTWVCTTTVPWEGGGDQEEVHNSFPASHLPKHKLFHTTHTHIQADFTSSENNMQTVKTSEIRRCTAKDTDDPVQENSQIYTYETAQLFSFLLFLNIPWCKRKILNVKTFLADELWWRVTRNLSWSVCVCVCAQLRSLFLRNAHFKFRTAVLLPGSTSSQIAVKILWSLSCSMFQVWRVHFQNKEYINI